MSTPFHRRVLAIHPAGRGFGYAVLESPTRLIDWGVKTTRQDKARKTLAMVSKLFKEYTPDILVVEDCRSGASRRGTRVEQLLTSIKTLAVLKGVRPCSISKRTVKNVFSAYQARNREQIAAVLAQRFPELAPWLPRHRKPWMSDDYRMAMFDAAALALACFHTRGSPRRPAGETLSQP
jgi:Holliday junction resolvasome RuvABC endonuclease subunit